MAIKLFLIFIIVLFLDLLVLPAFLGFRNSFLSLLILITPVLYMGPTRQLVIYGFVFTFVLEILRGLNFGELALPFLLTMIIIYLTQRFLNIKYTYDIRFSISKLIFVALVSVVFIYSLSFLFRQGSFNVNYLNPIVGLTITLEALILVLVFNIVFNKKNDYA